MSDKWLALAKKLEVSATDVEAAQEVVVGAIRGLLECATFGDTEALDMLRQIGKLPDGTLQDSIGLFTEALAKHEALSAEARATITKGDLLA